MTPKTALAGYYGVNYSRQNFFPDSTSTADPWWIIGYGELGSPNTNNQTIEQATLDWIQTFWKDPTFGAMQSYVQYSYMTRGSWYLAPEYPKNGP